MPNYSSNDQFRGKAKNKFLARCSGYCIFTNNLSVAKKN